ncbi:MAG: NusG domain II-containing protein [Clostridia bacterium]|nr:NusG domain II-containing protein [Clostridia bacterium]
MSNKKRNDIVLVIILAISAAVLFLCISLFSDSGKWAVVTVDGEEYGRYPLAVDTEIVIESEDGTNTLVIHGGKADVTDATCPDGLCVRFPSVSENGETIVCLPNKTVVTIVGEEENEVDLMG